MFPYFTLFGKTIYMYTVMALVGVFAAGGFCCYYAKKRFGQSDSMIVLLLVGAVGVFFGGHILYALTNIKLIAAVMGNLSIINSFKSFLAVVQLIFGGSVFYGGLLGGLAAGGIYIKVKKLDFKAYSDIAACGIPLFHVFGRIGCFLGGCCYGKESSIGFYYTNAIVDGLNGTTRFPIQLVEAAVNCVIFAAVWALLSRGILKGRLLAVYLAVYAVARFVLEFWRGDEYRGSLFGLSTSQFISVVILIVLIVWCIIKAVKRGKINQESAAK